MLWMFLKVILMKLKCIGFGQYTSLYFKKVLADQFDRVKSGSETVCAATESH